MIFSSPISPTLTNKVALLSSFNFKKSGDLIKSIICFENFLSIILFSSVCRAAYFIVVSVEFKSFRRVAVLFSKIGCDNNVSLCLKDFKNPSAQPVVPVDESHTADKQNKRPSFKIYFRFIMLEVAVSFNTIS